MKPLKEIASGSAPDSALLCNDKLALCSGNMVLQTFSWNSDLQNRTVLHQVQSGSEWVREAKNKVKRCQCAELGQHCAFHTKGRLDWMAANWAGTLVGPRWGCGGGGGGALGGRGGMIVGRGGGEV